MSIEVRDITFAYNDRHILKNASLQVEPGKTLAILGPNGSGKTTLLSIIARLLTPSSGDIVYDGKAQKALGFRELALIIGYVPQIINPSFDYSVLEYVVTGCAPRIGVFSKPKKEHYDAAMSALCKIGITHLAEKSYKRLSGGERQQVSIARVIAQSPAYILMDEPTAHLDYGNQIGALRIMNQLAQSGFGVVFTTHNPDQALLLGGKLAVMRKQGGLVCGDSNMITERFLSELYETELRITNPEGAHRGVCYAPRL